MAEHDSGSAAEKLTFLLVGAGIGAALALIFAPKSGRELRGDIADYTRKGIDAAGEGARQVGSRAQEYYEAGRGRATELYETGRGRVTEAYESARERVTHGAESAADFAGKQKDQIAAAVEAGKQAYREEKRKAAEIGGSPEVKES